ncbi:antitermination protein [Buttiauxella sp. B2]|nr:antitermination protein [Buttiauxella sp. B2]
MNSQLLEYARIELTSALADYSGGTKGQLEAFAEHPPADKNIYPRQFMHKVELEGGRKVKADNSALYVMETRSRRRPSPPMREDEFALCTWRRAILKLNESKKSWVMYCYGNDLSYSHQMIICQHLWSKYHALNSSKNTPRLRKCLAALTWLAVQDVAAKNKNVQYKEYAATTLASLMSVHRDTWYTNFASAWTVLKELARSLDMEALCEVELTVSECYKKIADYQEGL